MGDYVDRGHKSKQAVEQIKTLVEEWGVVALKGNHEQMLIDALTKSDEYIAQWIMNGGIQTVESYCGNDIFTEGFMWEQMMKAKNTLLTHFHHHIDFLNSLPFYYETNNLIFTHAGVNPYLSDWKNTNEEDFLWIRDIFHDNKVESTSKTIVFGHTPTINLHGVEDIWFNSQGDKIGVDGGCVYGLQLNLLEICEDRRYKTYFVRKGEK